VKRPKQQKRDDKLVPREECNDDAATLPMNLLLLATTTFLLSVAVTTEEI
jgi:hypothetical protein